MKNIALLMVVLATLAAAAHGHEKVTEHTIRLAPGAAPLSADIGELAWLVGRWTGEGLGGRTEEMWTPPDAGVMLGVFRMVRDDKPVFYEFITIAAGERGLSMKLKHFNPDMSAWEEKEKFVEFRYIGMIDGVYHFEGLAFHPEPDGSVTIFLALRNKDGAVREEVIRMRGR